MNHRNLMQMKAQVPEHGGAETPENVDAAADQSGGAARLAEVRRYRSLVIQLQGMVMVNYVRLEMVMENERVVGRAARGLGFWSPPEKGMENENVVQWGVMGFQPPEMGTENETVA